MSRMILGGALALLTALAAAAPAEAPASTESGGANVAAEFLQRFGQVIARPGALRGPGAGRILPSGRNVARVRVGQGRRILALSAAPLMTSDGKRVDLTLKRTSAGLEPRHPVTPVTVPRQAGGQLRLDDSGVGVSIGRVQSGQGRARRVRNAAFYADTEPGVDWAFVPVIEGVEVLAQIRERSAATALPLSFDLPPGSQMLPTEDGGVEVIRGLRRIARIEPALAFDARNRRVAASYRLMGTTLEIVVDHRRDGVQYPVLVDPVIEDWGTADDWYSNPLLDQYGWTSVSSPPGLFNFATTGSPGGSWGVGPGRGLYVRAPGGRVYPLGSAGSWEWSAPGSTAFISRADFKRIFIGSPLGSPLLPTVTLGLGDAAGRNAAGRRSIPLAANGADATVQVGDNVGTVPASRSRKASFSLSVTGLAPLNQTATAYLGGAVIYLDDPEAPTLSAPNHTALPTDWVSGGQLQVSLTATDPGLGVHRFELRSGGTQIAAADAGCNGNRMSRCQASVTRTIAYQIDGLPEGVSAIQATALDPVSHRSAPQSWNLKIDRGAPNVTTSGSLPDADGQQVGESQLAVVLSATDSGSGVRSATLALDGAPADQISQGCPAGGCALKGTLVLDLAVATEGSHEAVLNVTDGAGNATQRSWSFWVDGAPPELSLAGEATEPDRWFAVDTVGLAASARDTGSGVRELELRIGDELADLQTQSCPNGACDFDHDFEVSLAGLPDGSADVEVIARDGAGRERSVPVVVNIDRAGPAISLSGNLPDLDGGTLPSGPQELVAHAEDEHSGARSLRILLDGSALVDTENDCPQGACALEVEAGVNGDDLEPGVHSVEVVATDVAGNTSQRMLSFLVEDRSTAGPPIVAPELDLSAPTTLWGSMRFLLEGPDAAQTDVADGTLVPRRAAVIRGSVTDAAGRPVGGARVSVVAHPEMGSMTTREDGAVYLVVNGGGPVTVNIDKPGLLSAQRTVNTGWGEWTWLDDVVLVAADTEATDVDFGSETLQVHQASTSTDEDGARTPLVVVRPNTLAELVRADGSTEPLEAGHLRVTEYTVGDDGPAAMPGTLPNASAYTYAANFGFDEAVEPGDTVRFSQPVVSYTDNFLDIPVGWPVPAGVYDAEAARWEAEDSGRVMEILDEVDGSAVLDVEGNGQPASGGDLAALNIDAQELALIADRYDTGKQIWRVELPHFSVWDFNLSFGPPDGADYGGGGGDDDDSSDGSDDSCEDQGSIIECERQVLGERIPIAGTPFSLSYRSDRTLGWTEGRRLPIKISGPHVPTSATGISLTVSVAGQRFEKDFPPAPNQNYTYVWNGRDSFGRIVRGETEVRFDVSYNYEASYERTARFAAAPSGGGGGGGGGTGVASTGYGIAVRSFDRRELAFTSGFKAMLGNENPLPEGLGGWTVDVQHTYDSTGHVLYKGDGDRRSVEGVGLSGVLSPAAGLNPAPGQADPRAPYIALNRAEDIAFAADGSMYVVDGNYVRRIDPEGRGTIVAGNGQFQYSGDGGPATSAGLGGPSSVALTSDGSLFIGNASTLRRVDANGIIDLVAGDPGSSDPDPCEPPIDSRPAASGDGSSLNEECEDPCGAFGCPSLSGQGSRIFPRSASAPEQIWPLALAAGPAGDLFILDFGNADGYPTSGRKVYRLAANGSFTHVAGTGVIGYEGDGDRAVDAQIAAQDLAVGPDGTVYLTDRTRVRRVSPDGFITTIAGKSNPEAFGGDGGEAEEAELGLTSGIAINRRGELFVGSDGTIRKLDSEGGIKTIAGHRYQGYFSEYPPSGYVGPARRYSLDGRRMEVAPDGGLYITGGSAHVSRIGFGLPSFSGEDISIASTDGEEVYLFNEAGKHQRTVDAVTGATLWRFRYDGAGRLESIEDGDGNVTTLDRATPGQITITGPFGQETRIDLGADGFLEAATNDADESYEVGYLQDGLLNSFSNPAGETSTMTYELTTGKLLSDHDAGEGSQTLDRVGTKSDFTVTTTTAEGRSKSHRVFRDPETGALVRELTNTAGGTTTGVGEAGGRMEITLPDGSSATSAIAGDPRFGMTSPYPVHRTLTTPSGVSVEAQAHRSVQLRDLGDPFSVQSLEEESTIGGVYASVRTDVADRTTTFESEGGRSLTTEFDDLRRSVRIIAPEVEEVEIARDSYGRVDSVTQGNREATFAYDDRGHLASIEDPIGRTAEFEYDDADHLPLRRGPDGSVTEFDYDAAGRVREVISPSGVAKIRYSAVGRRASFHPVGAAETDPVSQIQYDKDGLITGIVRPDGSTITATQDDGGRLQRVESDDRELTFDYLPGTATPVEATVVGGQKIELEWDSPLLERVQLTGPVDATVSFEYGAHNRLARTMVNGSNEVQYEYDDPDALLTRAGDLQLFHSATTGRLERSELRGLSTTAEVDAYGDLSDLAATLDEETLLGHTFTRDLLGRVERLEEAILGDSSVFSYDYDDAGRLTRVDDADGDPVERYTYDAGGNRTSVQYGDELPIVATLNARDQLMANGTTTYDYDANGQLIESDGPGPNETATFEWNDAGQLAAVEQSEGARVEFDYDATGARITRSVDGDMDQRLIYGEADGPVAEVDADGDVTTRYVYGTNSRVPDYFTRGGATYAIVADQLGGPRLVVDVDTGEVAQRIDYDAFGRVVEDTNPGFQPFGFAGGLYDHATGLVQFGARYYDADLGRWISRDPIDVRSREVNLYSYARSNPVNVIDPSGLTIFEDFSDAVDDIVPDEVSNAAAGALNSITFGGSNALAGVRGECFGDGYGLGSLLGDLNPKGLFKAGARRFAAEAGDEGLETAARSYTDITKGSSVRNVGTDTPRTEFVDSLAKEGWRASTSKDGKVEIISKDGARYVLREGADSYQGSSVDFYPQGSSDITLKLRLGHN